MSDYVPTMEEVRDDYQWGVHACGCCAERLPEDVEAFDRWLAAHDAEVAAKALEAFAERLVKHQEHCYGSVLPDVTEVVDDLRIAAAEYRKAVES